MSRDPQRLPDYLGHILEAIERIGAQKNPHLPKDAGFERRAPTRRPATGLKAANDQPRDLRRRATAPATPRPASIRAIEPGSGTAAALISVTK